VSLCGTTCVASCRSPNRCFGNGKDDVFGDFSIKGTYSDKAPYPVDFTWTFKQTLQAMEFNGWRESDKGGVFGTWKGTNGSGTFAFSPAKESSEAVKKLTENTKNSTKEQLIQMGFPEWSIDQAMLETTNIEEAINWITQQMSVSEENVNTSSRGDSSVESGVDPSQLTELLAMGFDESMATQALVKTGNVEAAANWLFDRM